HVPAKPGTGSIAARPGQTIRRLLFPLSKSGRGKAHRHGHPVRKLHAAPRHGRGRAGARGAPRPGFGPPPEGALMARTVSDFVVQRLCDWGIRRVFGYPGDGINGFLGALDRASDRMEYVQVRHEEMAAFMACAHAKFTGEVGVCIATSGPGAIHLLNGLYDAKMDHQPVVAIVGQSATIALGGDFQQEVDLANLFKDVASEYVQVCTTPSQARTLVDRAVRIAKAGRTVIGIIFPNDVQEMDAVESPPRVHGATFTGTAWSEPRVIPKDEDLRRAADILNEGKKVAMLVGAGALHAADEADEVADLLGAGVAKAL